MCCFKTYAGAIILQNGRKDLQSALFPDAMKVLLSIELSLPHSESFAGIARVQGVPVCVDRER